MELIFLCVVVCCACGQDSGLEEEDVDTSSIELTSISAPSPVIAGSVLVAEARGIDPRDASFLELSDGTQSVSLPRVSDRDDVSYRVASDLSETFGSGTQSVEATIVLGATRSNVLTTELTFAESVSASLTRPLTGDYFRGDAAVLFGDGLPLPDEGSATALFVGELTTDAGATVPTTVRIPVEVLDRQSAEVPLGAELGGIEPGVWTGTVELEFELRAGESQPTAPVDVNVRFLPPELFAVSPTSLSVGQYIFADGAGFLDDGPTTVIEIAGQVVRSDGTMSFVGPIEVVPEVIDSRQLRLPIEGIVLGEELVVALILEATGAFNGELTPVVFEGDTTVRGTPLEVELTLDPVVQVVQVSFLPGFFESLERFGLAVAAGRVTDTIVERISDLYGDYRVDIRTEPVTDFTPAGYSVLEIGGPDPNGLGLLGYDNSPGKDVGNLRLDDRVGGENAETQADGRAGYGGVFIDTLLWWSSHPELPGERPDGAPPVDPLFDEVFDPVRTDPVSPAESAGEGDPERLAAVDAAIRALGFVVGETAAHELGHSFGLANPYGPMDVFHNAVDTEGCLMDAGQFRPFGERAGLEAFEDTELCGPSRDYMNEILGGN